MSDAMASEIPTAAENALHRMGERVATLEERVRGIGASVDVIRATDHEINGHMQKFVLAEQGCQQSLVTLTGQVSDLTRALAPIADMMKEFQRIHPELLAVVQQSERRTGVTSFGRRVGQIFVAGAALVSIVAALVAGVIWAAHHIALTP